ncbi:MAG: MBL fold metallo-hydrolase [Sphaerobacteraceae bacterium]|nr:MAG: MBL fold metallo-hydrolase [Sphaerobacteraceae bacterium]
MRVTPHGEYLVQFARWPRFFPVNVYLVREEDSLTLVDTGMSGRGPFIMEHVTEIGLPITRIVLTHSDPDHIGGMDELRKLLPEAEVLMTELSARVIRGEVLIDKRGNEVEPKTRRPVIDTRPTGTIEPGDMVGSLRVIAAPGHKPDQVAFLDTRDNTLIAGDAFQTQAGTAVAGTIRWLFPFPGLATGDKVGALNTARELRALEPSRLATGHGPVLENPLAEMDAAIAEAARKVERGASHAV